MRLQWRKLEVRLEVIMIANGYPYGDKGYVILEEGEINPESYGFVIHHYLVSHPDGSLESGTYTMDEAKAKIDQLMAQK